MMTTVPKNFRKKYSIKKPLPLQKRKASSCPRNSGSVACNIVELSDSKIQRELAFTLRVANKLI